MYNKLEDKAQRFGPSEIRAEILRQEIQVLEKAGPKDANDSQRLEELQLRLEDIEEPSQLEAQGRDILRRYLSLIDQIRESYEVPSDADKVFEEIRKWMDAMEDERRRRHLHHLSHVKQTWPVADWERRGKMLQRFGRHSIQRFAKEMPRYHIGRAVMGWVTMMAKKRR